MIPKNEHSNPSKQHQLVNAARVHAREYFPSPSILQFFNFITPPLPPAPIHSTIRQGAMERDLVSLLNPSPSREALGNPGNMDSCRGKKLGEIMRGGLPLDISPQSQNNFGGALGTNALDQLGNTELIGANSIQRGEFSSKCMITAPEHPRPFQGQNVGGRLHNAELATGAGLVTAERTLLEVGKKSAASADLQILLCV